MSFKCALANVPMGGGKSVIIGDPKTDKSEVLFRAFGRAVNTFGGGYHTGEDVGTTMRDMDWAASECAHVHGTSSADAGDPAPATAIGVQAGIEAAVKHKLGRDDMDGLQVAIQGVGSVGGDLARLLHARGARLIIADIDQAAVRACIEAYGAEAVGVDEILSVDAEVLAPCALGAAFDDDSIAKLACDVIAGSANNQLLEDRHGAALKQRGILYAPDYVINAGGVIWISDAMRDGFNAERATARLHGIADVLSEIFQRSDAEGQATNDIADLIARERINAVGG
jgi:leucine dehydrogenase